MKPFWVEGLYLNKQGVKKAKKTGAYQQTYVEPFAEVVWANTKAEALKDATEKLAGGEWLEEPKVTLKTEEQRMRSLGEPELPLVFVGQEEKEGVEPGDSMIKGKG